MTATCRLATPPARRLALAVLAAALAAGPGPAQAFTRKFAANSLIIPSQQEYQTDCGMVSAYGLVYTLLYKNQARVAAGKAPVTVYWVIEPQKQSHHRCNTATEDKPDFSKFNDNDGCDFFVEIEAAQAPPVARLNTSNGEDSPFNVFTTTYDKTAGAVTRTAATPATPIGTSKKVVKYSGGAWVIDATDRGAVLDLLASDTDIGTFRSTNNCTPNSRGTLAGKRMVEIHSARIGFEAPVAKMINEKPPLIALLGANAVTILEDYLKNAGLSSLPNAAGNTTTHGLIYDQLDPLDDFISTTTDPKGKLNMPHPTEAGRTFYQVLWAPHWIIGDQDSMPADGDPGDDTTGDGAWTHNGDDAIRNTLKNIAAFAAVGNGVFAECASIESFEGSFLRNSGVATTFKECECKDTSTPPLCATGDIVSGCAAGASAACGTCLSCDAGFTLDASNCAEQKCVKTTTCPAGYTDACGACYKCTNPSFPFLRTSSCNAVACYKTAAFRNRDKGGTLDTRSKTETRVATSAAVSCPANYSEIFVADPTQIDVLGDPVTRFHITNRLFKNAIDAFAAPDCSDKTVAAPATGTSKYKVSSSIAECIDFHPDTGGPGNLFSQKGDYTFTATSGHIHDYQPAAEVGSFYHQQVFKFATTESTTAARDNRDFTTARHKDGDPSQGMIVYLAGHSYSNSPAGNRLVLNTLLNLGYADSAVELARSEPVGYVTWAVESGVRVKKAETVFQGTYMQRSDPGPFRDWINYNTVSPKSWRFPYTDGHLRAYPLGSIATIQQDFQTSALWDAANKLPAPGARTMFTTMGGSANLGWKKVDFGHAQTNPTTCAPSGKKDALGRDICLLSDALSQCSTAGVKTTDLQAGDAGGAKAAKLGMFVQQVRGFCAAHDKSTGAAILEPTASQCDDQISRWQNNLARLGGVDHSSPAIVGPSQYLPDAKDPLDATLTIEWTKRPVVAYFGARDGMLHAVYVSGGAWSGEGKSLAGATPAGTELWAYLPPGQVCGLHTNTAMVDANVNVMDVFGDFPVDANRDGVIDLTSASERPDGIREWRTVLVAAAGEGGSELFALDVTNPLRPVLLWHLAGPSNMDDRWDANGDGDFADVGDHMSTTSPASHATTWFDWDDVQVGTKHIPTAYDTTDTTVLDAIKFGRYDYRNMGPTFGTAIGTLWTGRAFRFVAYVTTATADYTDLVTSKGYKGIEVFSLDLVSGQKQWQWQHRYGRKNAAGTIIADNGIPGRPALVDVDADGSVDRVYVGDLEGHLWELSATTGRNLNYLPSSDGKSRSFPLFGTTPLVGTGGDPTIKAFFTVSPGGGMAQQPLTSPVGIGRFTSVPTSLEPYLKDRIAVAQGTMGVDWDIAPYERGHVYAVPAYPETGTRLQAPITVPGSPDPLLVGVLKPEAVWDVTLELGERVFGMPKIVGNEMFINTSYGNFGDDLTTTLDDKGATKRVTAQGDTTKITKTDEGQKRFGGVLLFGKDLVITSDVGITRKADAGATGTTETKVRNRFTPTSAKTWEQRPDGTPPGGN